MHRKRLGDRGEQVAARFLLGLGYTILDRNWRCRHGELDIVARDGLDLVFVEVKTRSSLRYGHPFEAVTPAKLARIRALTTQWRAAHPLTVGSARIDVVSVMFPTANVASANPARPTIEHVRGVFA